MSASFEDGEGYVYYIKLRTNQGIFYKIGFTTMESVDERFSYGGSENYKLIEKVLLYKYSLYAHQIEGLLHLLFYDYRAYKRHSLANLFRDLSDHPLFKDGQSELYRHDVLGLDSDTRGFFGFTGSNKTDLVRKKSNDCSSVSIKFSSSKY